MPTYGEHAYNNRGHKAGKWDMAETNVLKHLYYLTTVSLLKDLNLDDIDEDLAWQYGMVYEAPWRDCNTLVSFFTNNYKTVLYQYVIQKSLDALREIGAFLATVYCADVTKLGTLINSFYAGQRVDTALLQSVLNSALNSTTRYKQEYTKIPMTAALVNQVDVILSTGKLMKATGKVRGKYINDRYIGNLKLVCNQITDLDNMLILNFTNIGNSRVVVNFEDSYLRQDQITDLMKLYCTLLENEYNTPFNIVQRDIHFDTIRTMTYMASALLHTFYHNSVQPEREEDMFRNAVESPEVTSILPIIREYTDKSLAYVLRMPFNVPNREWNKNYPERRNTVRPYSLQERYLTLWYKVFVSTLPGDLFLDRSA